MKLAKYELDAVVDTIIEQIKEREKDSPEQVEYQELVASRNEIIDELIQKRRDFNLWLVDEYSRLYPKLNFYINDYDKRAEIKCVKKPGHLIDIKTIERELIVSNIKGNVDETIKEIVKKYTK